MYIQALVDLFESAEANGLATVILTVQQHGPAKTTSNIECLPGKERRVYEALMNAAAGLAEQAGLEGEDIGAR
jgi:hypothetical protein